MRDDSRPRELRHDMISNFLHPHSVQAHLLDDLREATDSWHIDLLGWHVWFRDRPQYLLDAQYPRPNMDNRDQSLTPTLNPPPRSRGNAETYECDVSRDENDDIPSPLSTRMPSLFAQSQSGGHEEYANDEDEDVERREVEDRLESGPGHVPGCGGVGTGFGAGAGMWEVGERGFGEWWGGSKRSS
jgi:hypothetical protein